MDNLRRDTDTEEEQIALCASLAENIVSVVDSLEAMHNELAVSDSVELASFFEYVAAVVRLLVAIRTLG